MLDKVHPKAHRQPDRFNWSWVRYSDEKAGGQRVQDGVKLLQEEWPNVQSTPIYKRYNDRLKGTSLSMTAHP
jgi:hypothetical protein